MGIFKVKVRQLKDKVMFNLYFDFDKMLKDMEISDELLVTKAETLTLKGAKEFFEHPEQHADEAPRHPGCLIQKALEIRGVTQADFARITDINRVIINNIINGKRPITMEWALIMEEVLQIPAHLLLRMQLDYDIHQQRQQLLLARKEQREYELRRKMDHVLARLGDLAYIRSPYYRPNYEEYLRTYYDYKQ